MMKTLEVGAVNNKNDTTMANRMLMGHNKFNHQTLFHSQNHKFTVESGKASKEMKWFLGYKGSLCTPKFGEGLKNYLSGEARLTPAMVSRRVARKIIKPQKPKYISPIKIPYKSSFLGGPGVGTHSWVTEPNNWQSDNARDYGCAFGTPLVAVADGEIRGPLGPLDSENPRFAGERFYLHDEFGNNWYYAHCSEIKVKVGQRVKKGQTLAFSGRANGVAHLHIGEQKGNPMRDLPK